MATPSGKIYSLKRKKFLTPFGNGHGYERVYLWNNGKFVRKLVHNLIADTFLNKIEGKRVVNHKNCRKEDNKYSNLEFVTSSENRRHYVEFRKNQA